MMHQWNREKLRHFESGFCSLQYTAHTYIASSQQGMGIYSARYCCLNKKKDGLKDLITESQCECRSHQPL